MQDKYNEIVAALQKKFGKDSFHQNAMLNVISNEMGKRIDQEIRGRITSLSDTQLVALTKVAYIEAEQKRQADEQQQYEITAKTTDSYERP